MRSYSGDPGMGKCVSRIPIKTSSYSPAAAAAVHHSRGKKRAEKQRPRRRERRSYEFVNPSRSERTSRNELRGEAKAENVVFKRLGSASLFSQEATN